MDNKLKGSFIQFIVRTHRTDGSFGSISKTIRNWPNRQFYCHCEILSISGACSFCRKLGGQQVAKVTRSRISNWNAQGCLKNLLVTGWGTNITTPYNTHLSTKLYVPFSKLLGNKFSNLIGFVPIFTILFLLIHILTNFRDIFIYKKGYKSGWLVKFKKEIPGQIKSFEMKLFWIQKI